MSLAALRYRNASVFAGTALVVPPTSALAIASGWDLIVAGSAIGAMTTATVLAAPVWGAIDDRPGSRGLLGAAAGSALGSVLLWATSLAGFDARVVIPALCVFGAASGGLDPLVSARIQRAGWMHGLPRIRLFGAIGWCAGLVVALALTVSGLGSAVFLVAAAIFATVAAVEIHTPVRVAGPSAAVTPAAPPRSPFRRRTFPGGLVLFVLVGLPVPISAYSYLIYSSSVIDPLAFLNLTVPFLTLILLAAIELPVFAIVGSRLEGRSLVSVYVASLILLALSWLPSLLQLPSAAILAGLLAYTTAVVLWTVAQISAVRVLTTDPSAGVAHTAVSAATKTASAVLAGSGVGWIVSVLGESSAPIALILASTLGLFALGLAAIAFPSVRSARIPCQIDERKHRVNSDRRPSRH
jgi:hypothetical protein